MLQRRENVADLAMGRMAILDELVDHRIDQEDCRDPIFDVDLEMLEAVPGAHYGNASNCGIAFGGHLPSSIPASQRT
jgi:hypothetical protein